MEFFPVYSFLFSGEYLVHISSQFLTLAFCLLRFYVHVKNGASDYLVLCFGIICCWTFAVSLHPCSAMECAILMQVSQSFHDEFAGMFGIFYA